MGRHVFTDVVVLAIASGLLVLSVATRYAVGSGVKFLISGLPIPISLAAGTLLGYGSNAVLSPFWQQLVWREAVSAAEGRGDLPAQAQVTDLNDAAEALKGHSSPSP